MLIHKSNLTASFSMMIYFFITKGTRNERRILASTRHSEFQKYQPGITVRSSRSIKRLQSDEEDKVRAVISLGSLNLERPISENVKFGDLILYTIFHYPQEEGVARWALGVGWGE